MVKKMKTLKKVLTLLLVCSFVFGMFSCAKKEEPEQSTAPVESTEAEAPVESTEDAPEESTDTETAEDDIIAKIKANGKISMLTNAAFAPYEYLDAEGNITGVDVEICQAVADELGVELEIVDMDFDGIVLAIQTGKGELGAAGMTANDERKKSVDFSVNYVDTGIYMVTKADNENILTTEDLVGKEVGTQLGTTSDIFLSDLEGVEILRYKTIAEAAVALSNGQLDALVIDEMPAKDIVNSDDTLKLIDEPLTVEQYAIAIAKENTALKEVVDKVLTKLLEEGKVAELIEKHMAAAADV